MQEQLDRMIEDLNREIDIFLNAWSKTGVQREMKDLQMQLGNANSPLSGWGNGRLGSICNRCGWPSARSTMYSG